MAGFGVAMFVGWFGVIGRELMRGLEVERKEVEMF
jgi:hypothetical protein